MKKLTSQEWLEESMMLVNEDCESCQKLAERISKLSLVVMALAGKAPDNVRGDKVKA